MDEEVNVQICGCKSPDECNPKELDEDKVCNYDRIGLNEVETPVGWDPEDPGYEISF